MKQRKRKAVTASKTIPVRLAVKNVSSRVTLRCSEKSASGQPCKAAPLRGKMRCSFHSGDNAKRLGSRGGHRRAIYGPENLEKVGAPENALDMKRLLALTIMEVREGKLDPKIANAIGFLSASFLSTLEVADFHEKLTTLWERDQKPAPESVQ